MLQLVRAFYDIAILRLGPEDLPASRFLLGFAATAYLTTGVISVSFYARNASDAFLQLAADLGLLVAFITLLLVLYGKAARLGQTLTALLGTGALLALVALPLSVWLRWDDANGIGSGLPVAGLYLVVLWSIAVTGHILHRALEIPYVGGLVLGAAYFILNVATFAYLFPAEA
jgi:hypothetical protein